MRQVDVDGLCWCTGLQCLVTQSLSLVATLHRLTDPYILHTHSPGKKKKKHPCFTWTSFSSDNFHQPGSDLWSEENTGQAEHWVLRQHCPLPSLPPTIVLPGEQLGYDSS